MLLNETQARLEEMARNIKQETGCSWYTAYNIAVKVLVTAGVLEIQHQR